MYRLIADSIGRSLSLTPHSAPFTFHCPSCTGHGSCISGGGHCFLRSGVRAVATQCPLLTYISLFWCNVTDALCAWVEKEHPRIGFSRGGRARGAAMVHTTTQTRMWRNEGHG